MAIIAQWLGKPLTQDYANQLPNGFTDPTNGGGNSFDATPIMACRDPETGNTNNTSNGNNVFEIVDSPRYSVPKLVSDSRVFMFELNCRDPWDEDGWATPIIANKCTEVNGVGGPLGKPRNSVTVGTGSNHPASVSKGSEYWYSWAIYLPSAALQSDSIVIRELLGGVTDANPNKEGWEFQIDGDQLELNLQITGGGKLWNDAAANYMDAWHRFVVHVKWADDNTGFMRLYKDGDDTNLVNHENSATMESHQSIMSWHFGAYCAQFRNKSSDVTEAETKVVVAYDYVRIGDSGSNLSDMWPPDPEGGTPANNPPVANDISYEVASGGTLNISAGNGVLSNDTDADGDSLTATLVSGPSQSSSFTLNSDGSFDYTHNGSGTGTDSFTYKANDGTDDSNEATVTITISTEGSGGSLSVSDAASSGTVDLTTETSSGNNGLDWAKWNDNRYDHKAGVTTQISDATKNGTTLNYTATQTSYDWSDGTPVASDTGNTSGIRLFSLGATASFTITADKAEKRAKIYIGANDSKGTLTLSLSDSSAPNQSVVLNDIGGNGVGRVVTVDFSAASDGETLDVEYELTAKGDINNVTLEAVTLVTLATASLEVSTTDVTSGGDIHMAEWTDWSYIAPDDNGSYLIVNKESGGLVNDYSGPQDGQQGTLGIDFSWANGLEIEAKKDYGRVPRINENTAAGEKHEIELSAGTVEKSYSIYVMALNTSGDLKVSLDDNSAPAVTKTLNSPTTSKVIWRADITVTADTDTVLRVTWEPNTANGATWLISQGPVVQGSTSKPANTAPTMTSIADKAVIEGNTIGVHIEGTDTDSSPDATMTFLLDSGPDGLGAALEFSDNGDGTATLVWETTAGDQGVYDFTVLGHDGLDVAEVTFTRAIYRQDHPVDFPWGAANNEVSMFIPKDYYSAGIGFMRCFDPDTGGKDSFTVQLSNDAGSTHTHYGVHAYVPNDVKTYLDDLKAGSRDIQFFTDADFIRRDVGLQTLTAAETSQVQNDMTISYETWQSALDANGLVEFE